MNVQELLAQCLLDHQEEIWDRLWQAVRELPEEQASVQALAQAPDYRESALSLLRMLAQSCRDDDEEHFLEFARRRALTRLQQNVPASHTMRLSNVLRQSVHQVIQEVCAGPEQAQGMLEVFEARLGEFEVNFSRIYQAERDVQWRDSQTKYYWLFENASEAILSFRPHEGRLIEANAQAERLLGCSREEILSTPFVDLFAAEHRAQAQWLVEQDSHETGLSESSLRLDDVAMRRADNSQVPVSLSCNWIETEGHTIAQVILRDMTQLRQMQREMQSYAEQLEARVTERTRELQQSEDRYRALFLQEQRRAQHLSLINEVQKTALATRDVETFVLQVTRAIQSHFRDSDVTFFLRALEPDEILQDLSPGMEILPEDAIDARDESVSLIGVASSGLNEAPSANGAPRVHEAPRAQGPTRSECEGSVEPSLQLSEADIYALREASLGGVAGGDLVVVAQAGGHGFSPAPGEVFAAGEGLPGETILGGSAPRINHYDEIDESIEYAVRSEACVPLRMEERAIGALLVQSSRRRGLEARDIVALQTACGIIAAHIEWNRLFQQMQELNSFNHSLITTMLHSLLVVGADGKVRLVNERCCQTLHRPREEILHQPLSEVLGEAAAERHKLVEVLHDVTENGVPREIPEVQVFTSEGLQVFDVRVFRLYFRSEAQVVVLLINITRRWRQTQQLQVMNQISHLFQTSLDMDRVLHTVLVCITAGSALGFNRAFLLLLDAQNKTLTGAQAIGPASADEASRIWMEMSRSEPTLEELLAYPENEDSALRAQVQGLRISLDNPCFAPLAEAVREQQATRLRHSNLILQSSDCRATEMSEEYCAEREAAAQIFTAPDAVVAPLIAKDRVVGIVLADNLYSGTPIDVEDVQLLETLAHQAGLTVDNALTYQELQKAQKELVSAERLAAVGEMAARVSHEIRNPLATIGGFARSILKRPQDSEAVERKTRILVDEVTRLEELLNDLLDMARPRSLDLQAHNLDAVIDHALLLADADIKGCRVTVEKDLAEIPPVLMDRSRLLQALLNITRNGAQAMPDGGTLYIATRLAQRREDGPCFVEIEVRDTGVGMTERAVKQIFDPFFSTKISGSGLGLAVTRRIVEDHGGEINVFSREGGGTTFLLSLPYRPAPSPPSPDRPTLASASAD